jgi:uncharacterized membrane protein
MTPKKKHKKYLPPKETSPAPMATETVQSLKQRVVQIEEKISVGPLPPPEVLREYEETLPGSAERIISMAERQARHRQELEKVAVKAGARDSLLGLIFGLIIGLAAILGGVFIAYSGKEIGGSVLGGGGLVSLVTVFVYGSKQRRLERERKREMME